MKKILSVILVITMLLTSFTSVFAAESEDAGKYNSLKLPVINEVIDENTEDAGFYSMQPMSLMSVTDDMPTMGGSAGGSSSSSGSNAAGSGNTSGGGGGGGAIGGGGSVVNPEAPVISGSTLTITGIPEQTENKGDLLVIENFNDYISEEAKEQLVSFYSDYYDYKILVIFEKDGEETMFFAKDTLLYDLYWEPIAFRLPVPVELENGTYNVSAHQFNDVKYRYDNYTDVIFELELNVTDADTQNAYPYSLNDVSGIENDPVINILEGSYYEDATFTFKDELPGGGELIGVAIDENGAAYGIGASTYDGKEFFVYNNICELPLGKYECYFYMNRPDFDYDEYPDSLYGPLTVNVSSLAFGDKYYPEHTDEVWTHIELGASAASRIPYDVEYQSNRTLSFDFKDANGNIVSSLDDVFIEDLWLQGWDNGEEYVYYGGDIYFYLYLVGLKAGTYTADVTLNDENGNSYELGSATLNITDKTILDDAYILNYSGTLTTATQSFYVSLRTSNMFLDYDKISVNLLDEDGNVVAQTVSKELRDVSSYSGSDLLYKLNVTGTLDEDSRYYLEIQSASDVELISAVDSVRIRVTSEPCVIRAEFTGTNTVKVYTENVLPGEYLVEQRNSDTDVFYNVIIDEQGVGTFQVDNIEDTYLNFYLKTLEDERIDSFNVRIDNGNNNDNFHSNPEFISVNTTKIDNFYVRPLCDADKPNVQNIEYARLTQNGDVIATMSNFNMNDWSYYYREAGTRLNLYSTLTVVAGKKFTKGEATLEVKYKDGFIYTSKLPVTDETTDLYGNINIGDHCYYQQYNGNYYSDYAVGSNKVNFSIKNTNAVTGTVSLLGLDGQVLESYQLSQLTKTVKNGCYYTYTGSFNTTLSTEGIYSVVYEANDDKIGFWDFVYYPGKIAEQNSDLMVYNGEGDIYLYDWLNISNINNLTFKAVVGNNTYNIPATVSYSGDNYIDFVGDFSSVPVGYFTLKAYDGATEVELTYRTLGYNFGYTTEPMTSGTGWRWVGANKDVREFCVYGVNLNLVNEAAVKVYEIVDFPESDYNDKTKLQYVKDIKLPKPYNQTNISISNQLIAGLETGKYMFVYVIDGEAVESQEVYLKGTAPSYNASIVVNGGISSTNKPDTEILVSATGYTKMRIAFSKAELEAAQYEAITGTKNLSFEGKNGLVTIYVQFANDDESKTEIVESSITVDTLAPSMENVNIPELELWESTEITFVTNELLRNAFMIVGELNSSTGAIDGRNYVFAYAGAVDGKYTYKCNLYADSNYVDISSLKTQIVAYDKAGNAAHTEIRDLKIAQPRDISGTLTYNGSVVKSVAVYLYDENGKYVDYSYTNNVGEYTFTNITKGNYSIEVSSHMYEKATLSVTADEFDADITGKNIDLTSVYSNNSTVTVTVKDYNNQPVQGAYVSVYSWDTGDYANATDENGVVAFNVPYQNGGTQYRVYANHNDYSRTEYVRVDADTKSVDVSFPQKATISGVALKGEDKVANTEVTIEGNGYTTYTHTNENGEFTVDVYLVNGNKTFVVSVRDNSKYSGSETVEFTDSLEANITLNLKGNIRVKGAIKDNMAQTVGEFSSINFSGNGLYLTVTPDANGEFETPDVFGVGTYSVYAYDSWPYEYETISETIEITEEDLESSIKELNLVAVKRYAETNFTTGENKITATADVIAKGDTVTVNVKFQNDGTSTLSNVVAYATIPEGAKVIYSNGDNGTAVKTVSTLKADETGTLTFTIDTKDYNEKSLVILAYVKVGNKEYPLGAVTVEIASVTLSAPQVVKANTSFKVSGEAISGSTVEILNYNTKEVLATTDLTSKWYFADISGISEDTTLIAKVSKDGKIGYSEPVTVKVEENPIAVKDVKIKWGYNLDEYGINENFGYPTLSIWEGYEFTVSTSFENMPANATVTYSFINKNNVPTTKSGEYYKGTIRNWSGYGTKKVIATVTDGDKEYEFIVAELIILIDPSGYVTDSETGEPIVGANVLLEVKSGDEWITWDSTPHLQQNPMLTDEEGHYGWMVPEGEYRIIVTADGYETKVVETYYSSVFDKIDKITVLPVRTDVDIELENARAVEVDTEKTASVAGGKIKFVFTRPVDPATVTAENFKVLKADGTEVAGSVVLAENNTVALFKPTTAMANGDYKLSVANIKDGSDNVLPAEEIPFEKQTDIAALANPTVAYNTTNGTVTITFAQGKVPVNAEEIVVKNGNSVVNGTLRAVDNVITFIPDNAFASSTSYKVVVSDSLRTSGNEYLAASFEKSFTTSGTTPGNPPSGPQGGGGGGGAAPSIAKPEASVNAGEVEKGTKVELSTTTKGAKIYYTVDGTQPTEKSTLYSEAIIVNEDVTIKAIAIKDSTKSSVMTATYTVKKVEENKDTNTDTTTKAPAFADLSNYAWASEAIVALAEKGIIKGVSDTKFAPASDIKRADFMLLLVRMLDLKAQVTDNFDDVTADKYYYEGIGVAKALGLTTGVGGNKFNPEANITRQDMFVLAYRILKMQESGLIEADESVISSFDDYSKIADYAKEGLSSLVKNELVKGSDNKINPVGNATRAETAVFIYRLYNLLNK